MAEKIASAIKTNTLRKTQSALTFRNMPTKIRMIAAAKTMQKEARHNTMRAHLGDIAKKQITKVILQKQNT